MIQPSLRDAVDTGEVRVVGVVSGGGWVETIAIVEGGLSELIGAFALTILLGMSGWLRSRMARRRDLKYIRGILIQGQQLVMGAKDVDHEGVGAISPADVFRAAQYNNMIRRLRPALERWAVNLSHADRRDVFNALDWFHTEGLMAVRVQDEMVYVHVPDGEWPAKDMSLDAAREIFEKLQAIKWLKLKAAKMTPPSTCRPAPS